MSIFMFVLSLYDVCSDHCLILDGDAGGGQLFDLFIVLTRVMYSYRKTGDW